MQDLDRPLSASVPNVVVIGGGFAGRRVQKLLDVDGFVVTLVDAKGYFEYTPSALRCMVEHERAKMTVIPQPARTVVDQVVGFDLRSESGNSQGSSIVTGVRLASGNILSCDVVVVATGSSYTAPVKGDQLTASRPERRWGELAEVGQQIAAAKHICVVGGGTVGVELAAEIAHKYRRSKRITLVASQPKLLDRMAPSCGSYAAKWLTDRGVEVILGQRVTDWGGADGQGRWGVRGQYRIVTSKAEVVHADLVFCCVGSKNHPGGAWEGLPISGSGGIKVLPTLQVEGIANAYAVGDAADTRVEKTALSADLSANLAAWNIMAVRKSSPQKPFPQGACHGAAFVPDIQAVSLGPCSGTMQFNSLVASGPLVALVKSLIEYLQVGTAAGRRLHAFTWSLLEKTNVFLGTCLFVTAAQRAVSA